MNKVIIMGRLTKVPDVRYTQVTNKMVVSFNLAVNRRFTKEGEEQQADFLSVVSYGKIAEFISKYFSKGQQILICGRLQTRNWEDDQGQKHYVTEIIAEEAYFADSKKAERPKTDEEQVSTELSDNDEVFSSEDDDLPF